MRTHPFILMLSLAAFRLNAAGWQEDFSTDPLAHGWQIFGDTSLFSWNAPQHCVQVTWNTEQTNSFFHRPLGTIVARDDNFTVGFDLRLETVDAIALPGKQYAFEIAAGLLNISQATATNFFRGDGSSSPNLVEFDYFPDTGYSETLSPTLVSSNSNFRPAFIFPYELLPDDWHRIALRYTASNATLAISVTNLNTLAGTNKSIILDPGFGDFRVNTFAISSYEDRSANGSVRIQGSVANVFVTVPDPPVANLAGGFSDGSWQTDFLSRTNWIYTLERATTLDSWSPASAATNGTGRPITLTDTNVTATNAFYRIRAQRP